MRRGVRRERFRRITQRWFSGRDMLKIDLSRPRSIDILGREMLYFARSRPKEVETDVEEKIKRLKVQKGMSVRPVLIYDGTLDPQLSGSGFFVASVNAATLLNRSAQF